MKPPSMRHDLYCQRYVTQSYPTDLSDVASGMIYWETHWSPQWGPRVTRQMIATDIRKSLPRAPDDGERGLYRLMFKVVLQKLREARVLLPKGKLHTPLEQLPKD